MNVIIKSCDTAYIDKEELGRFNRIHFWYIPRFLNMCLVFDALSKHSTFWDKNKENVDYNQTLEFPQY